MIYFIFLKISSILLKNREKPPSLNPKLSLREGRLLLVYIMHLILIHPQIALSFQEL